MAKLLIVDDDAATVQQLQALVRQSGHTCQFALGLEFVGNILAQEPIELLLLDVHFPEGGGLELLKRLQGHPQHRRLPVIMITADDSESLLAECLDAGARDFLRKPVGAVEFRARVGAALRLERVQRRLLEELGTQRKLHLVLQQRLGQMDQMVHEVQGLFHRSPSLLTEASAEVFAELPELLSSSATEPPSVRRALVETLQLAVRLWESGTGAGVVELAEASGLWTVSRDPDGGAYPRTLEKYLSLERLPRHPRWRNVVQTATFVLRLKLPDPDMDLRLRLKLEELGTFLRQS
jgi:DNA-binding response OmpR family regulator